MLMYVRVRKSNLESFISTSSHFVRHGGNIAGSTYALVLANGSGERLTFLLAVPNYLEGES